VVDVHGPSGVGLSAVCTGHLKTRAFSRGSARSRHWSSCGSPSSSIASRLTT
jgi:hypothetical protein